ncbi:NAD(P)/FAD-dependent oxidoreductase [Selenomonas sputigena]|uniref:NAD(P)/FAD-dependent oxidoreductase n=1 Tax=Selenomonas sputigena TaxID=69823 RepID=A0ABV3X6B0_9FIRM
MSGRHVIVVGGGPAGFMAAAKAAEEGASVLLLEKMKKLGRKMMITGKGRCNITNAAPIPELVRNIPGNGSFLYSALHAFDNEAVRDFFAARGVETKVERGGRVFPQSDRAADAVDALVTYLHELGVKIKTEAPAADILVEEGRAAGVVLVGGAKLRADAVVLAVGGASYPATGSTGDGYGMARRLGHTVTQILPSLVPLVVEEDWVKEAQGLSLRNVRCTLLADGKKCADAFGEMMFTHFGVTGPIILSLSRMAAQALAEGSFVELELDLKPALAPEIFAARVQRDFEKYQRKVLKNAMHDLLPGKLIAPVLDAAYLEVEKPVHQVTREERLRLTETIRHLMLTVTKTRPLAEAIVTAGGIATREIEPKTMQSKLLPGLYFAGEVVDVDGFTGGYNLQAAFSMGAAAGRWSARKA